MRLLLRLIAAVLALPTVYVLSGLLGALIPSGGDWPQEGLRVGLLRGPIHYDFLLPADAGTRAGFAFAEVDRGVPVSHPDARWLVVGWGSAAFYTTAGTYADIAPSAVWTAATGDAAVMRVDVWGALPDEDWPGLRWVTLTPVQYAALRGAILASFHRNAGGRPVALPVAGFTGTDGFWQAEGRFDLFRTCNVWVGRMLRQAGLRFGLWTPTPQAVSLSLATFAPAPPAAP
jgi:uncharacterized protein (TIGR02117 family)